MYYDLDGNPIGEDMAYGMGYAVPTRQPYDGYGDISDPAEVARLQQIYNSRPDLQQQWADATAGRPWETHPFDGNPLQFIKWADEQEAVQGAQPQAGAPQVVTQSDILGQIDNTPLAVMGRQDQARDFALADQQGLEARLAAERDLAARINLARTQGQYMTGLATQYGNDARARAEADRGASLQRLDAYTTGQRNLIEGDSSRRYAETDTARDTRLGELDRYITAWDRNAQVARDRAVDQTFSRGGVTGMIGQTQRGVGQVEQDYARDRATTEAKGRQSIVDDYLGQRYSVGDWRYGQLSNLNADNFQAGEGVYSTARGRINQIDDQVYGDTRGAASDAFADVGRGYDLYSGADSQNRATRFNQYQLANDNASRYRTQAYGDFRDYLSGQETAGREAAFTQSNAGQNYTTSATRFNSDAATARAEGRLASADAYATGLNNAANAVGDYWAKRRGRTTLGGSSYQYPTMSAAYDRPGYELNVRQRGSSGPFSW